MKSKVNKNNNFALLHIAGAMMVTWGHSFALLQIGAPGLYGDVVHGIGLYILMCVSGYLVMKSLERSDGIIQFYQKRFGRLYPSLLLSLLLMVLVLAPNATVSFSKYMTSAVYYIKHQLAFSFVDGIAGVFRHNPLAGSVAPSLWSLSYEVLFYLLMPVLLFAFRKNKKVLLAESVVIYVLFLVCAVWAPAIRTLKVAYWAFQQVADCAFGNIFFSWDMLESNSGEPSEKNLQTGMGCMFHVHTAL